MPANVESMVYVKDRGVPWHGFGTAVDGLMTGAEVLEKAGLDWQVEKRPLYIDPPEGGLKNLQLVQSHEATVRVSDNSVLGVVGKVFTPTQNSELADCMDAVVDSGEAKYETAGSLLDGRRVFISMEMPKHISVAGDDSEFESYLLGVNGHDGGQAFEVLRTTVRVVCWNTLQSAKAKALAKFSARHTTGVTARVGEIRDALALEFKGLETFNEVLNKMARARISEARGREVLLKVFPLKADDMAEADLAKSDFAAALANWRTTETISDKLRGTNYGLFNAITEYADFGLSYRKPDRRALDLMFSGGRPGAIKERSLSLLK
jgi:phage/plasmid-like protein (TIGR03299 family)